MHWMFNLPGKRNIFLGNHWIVFLCVYVCVLKVCLLLLKHALQIRNIFFWSLELNLSNVTASLVSFLCREVEREAWSIIKAFQRPLRNRHIELVYEKLQVLSNMLQLSSTDFPKEHLLPGRNLIMFGDFTPQANGGLFRHARVKQI